MGMINALVLVFLLLILITFTHEMGHIVVAKIVGLPIIGFRPCYVDLDFSKRIPKWKKMGVVVAGFTSTLILSFVFWLVGWEGAAVVCLIITSFNLFPFLGSDMSQAISIWRSGRC